MKEASWSDCLATNSARTVTPNKQRARALLETAQERIAVIKEINEKNCNVVFEDYYTSLIEILQAMVIQRGYNIGNHVCLGFYLRDVLRREDIFALFDDVRQKRNSLTYYGNRMDAKTANQAIERCKKLISILKNL